MNRRLFLTSASTAAALAVTGSLTTSRALGQSAGSTSPVYGSSNSVSALTSGNMIVGTASGSDWSAIANSLVGVQNDWSANGIDNQIGYSNFSPSQMKSGNLNQNQILSDIQAYNPSVALAQLQSMWRTYDNTDPNQLQSVITTLTQQGMGNYFNSTIDIANRMAVAYNGISGNGVSASAQNVSGNPIFSPSLRPKDPPVDGGGGYTCAQDGMVTAAVGLAFLTIGIMSGIGLFAGAAWGIIAVWGGGATTVYGLGHNFKCGF